MLSARRNDCSQPAGASTELRSISTLCVGWLRQHFPYYCPLHPTVQGIPAPVRTAARSCPRIRLTADTSLAMADCTQAIMTLSEAELFPPLWRRQERDGATPPLLPLLLSFQAPTLTLTSKGRLMLMLCTVAGLTPNLAAILRTPSVRPGLSRAALMAL